MPVKLSKDKVARIVVLRAVNYNHDEIAEMVGVSRDTVSRYLSKIQQNYQDSGFEVFVLKCVCISYLLNDGGIDL